MSNPLFPLGQTVSTPGAMAALEEAKASASTYLNRHVTGDWGELSPSDARENVRAVEEQLRIFSAYILATGVKIWIITEWDRSVTTILLPEEY